MELQPESINIRIIDPVGDRFHRQGHANGFQFDFIT